MGKGPVDDWRLPVITACCAALGLPLGDVLAVESGRYSPRVRIDLNPWSPGDGTITYRVGLGGWVAVRGGVVERVGIDADDWDPPMTVDDAAICAALADAHNALLGGMRCENRPMNYPKYPGSDDAPEDTMHPAVRQALRGLDCDHLPDDLRAIAEGFRDLGLMMAEELPSDPEVTVGIRKLVEAKDCAVRAAVFNRATP